MAGKILTVVIVMFALVAGVAVYWLQEYAYYREATFTPGTEILLTPKATALSRFWQKMSPALTPTAARCVFAPVSARL